MAKDKNIPLVDLKAQYFEIKEDLWRVWSEILESMRLYLGLWTERFEKEYGKYCGVNYCITVANGTEAVHLSLRALDIKDGDEVITTPLTFAATVEAIWMVGAKPVFVDINEDDYTINPNLIEDKITPKTKAILPVHLYGHPADMDRILEIAKKYNLYVVEDSAQAQGAEYKGKKVGSLGDVSAFSFYFSKNLGAFGEAGAVTTSKKEIYDKLVLLRCHGQKNKYIHLIPGFNARTDELQCAVLYLKLKKLDDWNKRRRKFADMYRERLKDLEDKGKIKLLVEKEWGYHVYHLFVIRVLDKGLRDKLFNFLKEKGIGVGIHYPIPLHLQPAFSYLNYKKGDFPVAERVAEEVISLPMHPHLKEEDIDYIADKIKEFFESV